MRKRGHHENKGGKTKQVENTAEKKGKKVDVDDDSANQGFSDWLRSTDGVEMMRLFVLANSLLVFVTMAWPNMRDAFTAFKDYFFDDQED